MNKSGFIILELLLSIIIIATILILLNSIFLSLNRAIQINQKLNNDTLLLVKMQEDLKLCQKIDKLEPFSCTLYNGQSLSYTMDEGNKLIRKVDNQGYEIIDNNLNAFKVTNIEPVTILIDNERTYVVGVPNE